MSECEVRESQRSVEKRSRWAAATVIVQRAEERIEDSWSWGCGASFLSNYELSSQRFRRSVCSSGAIAKDVKIKSSPFSGCLLDKRPLLWKQSTFFFLNQFPRIARKFDLGTCRAHIHNNPERCLHLTVRSPDARIVEVLLAACTAFPRMMLCKYRTQISLFSHLPLHTARSCCGENCSPLG